MQVEKALTSRMPKVGLIGVPYNVGWRSPGIDECARAFRDAGFVDELKMVVGEVVDCGDVEVRLPLEMTATRSF